MSNLKFKVIFTEADRNTADNARQYYEGKHKKYEEILDVADCICLISALFFYHTCNYNINNNLFQNGNVKVSYQCYGISAYGLHNLLEYKSIIS